MSVGWVGRTVAWMTGGLVMALAWPAGSAVAQFCTSNACTISDGLYGSTATIATPQPTSAFTLTNLGTFLVDPASGWSQVMRVVSQAPDGASSSTGNATAGQAAGAITFSNQDTLTLTGPTSVQSGSTGVGALIVSQGGAGGSYTNSSNSDVAKFNAASGGNGGAITVTNAFAIAITAPLPSGGIGLGAQSIGGDGGSVAVKASEPTDSTTGLPNYGGNSGYGGTAGSGGVVSVTNSAAISIATASGGPLPGGTIAASSQSLPYTPEFPVFGVRGISASSLGGQAGPGAGDSGTKCDSSGDSCGGGAGGGAAGAVTIVNSGPVTINWDWGQTGSSSPLSPDIAFGVIGTSVGANGQRSVSTDFNGGPGGSAGAISITLNAGGDVTLSTVNAGPPLANTDPPLTIPRLVGAGVAALSTGGDGAPPYGASHPIGDNPVIGGGSAGSAGSVIVSVNQANVTVTGDRIAAIVALAQGGLGGSGNYGTSGNADYTNRGGNAGNGGNGGAAGSANVGLDGALLSTNGSFAPAVIVASLAGAGGVGSTYLENAGGDAGFGRPGGTAGDVKASWYGSSVQTMGQQSPALLAMSRGGDGGTGGDRTSGGSGDAGGGGNAGSGGGVLVQIQRTNLGTVGQDSPGIVAASTGGKGGSGGTANSDGAASPHDGGNGGNSGFVSVTIDAGSSVTTMGANSSAIVASSVSGFGGNGTSDSNIISSQGGQGGAGGTAGSNQEIGSNPSVLAAVEVENAGALSTTGDNSLGIVAQAMSGGGGAGGAAGGIVVSGGSGASAGAIGQIDVGNTGSITTRGVSAHAILAQSIGGGGGNGGSLDFANSGIGGNSGVASSGGSVNVVHNGVITTSGSGALGIVAQSIGGGGGNGGNAEGLFSIGGQVDSGGGNGGSAFVYSNGGSIFTAGQQSHGVVVQSIGGGGGNGGSATSASFLASLAIGGTGGAGGAGGSAGLSANNGSILTQSTKAAGLVVQSVGGGGGSGGAAYANSAGVLFSAGVAVGGSGGSGGSGGQVSVDLSSVNIVTGQSPALTATTYTPTNLLPVDAFGIVAQSISGGGGMGGSASAASLAVAVPIPETGLEYGMSVALAMGGSAGTGGSTQANTSVVVALNGGTNVLTYGMGSHGVMAQSIGGGGGEGGDSSAMAATIAYGRAATIAGDDVIEVSAAVALGASGGSGGTAGPVNVTLADSGPTPASITTLGDFADGILAQSIGGGGGNAGIGATSSANFGGTQAITMSAGLGGSGGAGGAGGNVLVTVNSAGSIATYGDGANAIAAQSIGGGGGASQGGTINLGLTYQFGAGGENQGIKTVQPAGSLTFNLGAAGGSGMNGGAVTVNMAGAIYTQGNDSTGILAQSIGGGGGLGGAAGSSASADNPISGVTKLRTLINDITFRNVPATASLTLNMGNDAKGQSGDGGTVSVTHSGTIITQGDWASGIFAQSLGGGGGRGGVAAGTGSGPGRVVLDIGQSGLGSGGAVNVTLQGGSIATGATMPGVTGGYAAFGLVAQSVGGGGGFGADNSDAANGTVLDVDNTTIRNAEISIGSLTGNGHSSGSGGAVNLTGDATITTLGEGAHGVVLQSIGGGGGIGGAGSSRFGTDALGNGVISVNVGGGSSAFGGGGTVTVTNAALAITTSGINAYGVLAQSIGGGGGLGFTQQGVPANFSLGGGTVNGGNSAGTVSLTLVGSRITTHGAGSMGIVAQSIGGGGGIAGYGSGTTTLARASSAVGGSSTSYNTSGNGSSVTINTVGSVINTFGASAHGIFAQSIGGGGGLVASSDATTLYAGSTGVSGSDSGAGGAVTINQSGSVSAGGTSSVGIFAQSHSPNGTGGTITVRVDGFVTGGGGPQAAAIWIDSGNASNTVTIGQDGGIGSGDGNAIFYTGAATLNVTNNGSIIGDVFLNGVLDGTLTNAATGVWRPLDLSAAHVANSGRIVLGSGGAFSQSTITGNFTQTESGVIVATADFGGRRADSLRVMGNATLAGSVLPVITSVLPNISIPVMVVDGSINGALTGASSALFGYGITRSGNQLMLSARSANFAPASFGLASSRSAVADHLQAAWDQGGNQALGSLFALLGNTADVSPAAYGEQLRQLSPDSTFAPGARGLAGTHSFANSALSCPTFEGSTAMLVEGSCSWVRLTGRHASQHSGNGVTNYTLNSMTWQIGGQTEIAPNLLIGGSLAYETNRLSSSDRLNSGNGQGGYGALTLKYQTGPWLFSAAGFGGGGQYQLSRVITLPGLASVARGSPAVASLGTMVRATYTIGGEQLYLRPNLSLSAIHVRTGGYREDGGGTLNLSVNAASQTTLMATPMLEVGGRIALGDDTLLRLYAAAGANLLSNNAWHQTSRLVSAPAGTRGFSTSVPVDPVAGRVSAGAQLYTSQQLDFRLQYDGEFSRSVSAHAGSLVASLRF